MVPDKFKAAPKLGGAGIRLVADLRNLLRLFKYSGIALFTLVETRGKLDGINVKCLISVASRYPEKFQNLSYSFIKKYEMAPATK